MSSPWTSAARNKAWGGAAALAALLLPAAAMAQAAPADTVRYPYVAALSRSSDGERVYFCAGALIAPRWILTAAHCFHSPGGVRIGREGLAAEVGAGLLRDVPRQAQVPVARIVVHPDYRPDSQANDIALVELTEEAGPLIAEVAPTRGEGEPAEATVLGFGSFYEGRLAANALSGTGAPAAQLSDRLRQAIVRIVDPASCAASGVSQICAGAGPETNCIGDSGGPLVVEAADRRDRIVGIVSDGSGCAAARPVTIYTRVSAYAPWIAATIGGR